MVMILASYISTSQLTNDHSCVMNLPKADSKWPIEIVACRAGFGLEDSLRFGVESRN